MNNADTIKPTDVAKPAPAIPKFKYFIKKMSQTVFITFDNKNAQNCNLIKP